MRLALLLLLTAPIMPNTRIDEEALNAIASPPRVWSFDTSGHTNGPYVTDQGLVTFYGSSVAAATAAHTIFGLQARNINGNYWPAGSGVLTGSSGGSTLAKRFNSIQDASDANILYLLHMRNNTGDVWHITEFDYTSAILPTLTAGPAGHTTAVAGSTIDSVPLMGQLDDGRIVVISNQVLLSSDAEIQYSVYNPATQLWDVTNGVLVTQATYDAAAFAEFGDPTNLLWRALGLNVYNDVLHLTMSAPILPVTTANTHRLMHATVDFSTLTFSNLSGIDSQLGDDVPAAVRTRISQPKSFAVGAVQTLAFIYVRTPDPDVADEVRDVYAAIGAIQNDDTVSWATEVLLTATASIAGAQHRRIGDIAPIDAGNSKMVAIYTVRELDPPNNPETRLDYRLRDAGSWGAAAPWKPIDYQYGSGNLNVHMGYDDARMMKVATDSVGVQFNRDPASTNSGRQDENSQLVDDVLYDLFSVSEEGEAGNYAWFASGALGA